MFLKTLMYAARNARELIGRAPICNLKFFDEAWYLAQNNDVAAKKVSALKHYRKFGWREGRWPNPIFDPRWYVRVNADVAQLGIEPLEHFERHGRFEGRRPSAEFDPAAYLRLNPDVAASKVEPSEHYLRYGRSERRATKDYGILVNAMIAMRDMMAVANFSHANELTVEAVRMLGQLDDAQSDWRSRLLAKAIYNVDEEHRPVPDGLSYDYLELADTLNNGGIVTGGLTYADRIELAGADPIGATEALMQRELGEAAKLHARLLRNYATRLRR